MGSDGSVYSVLIRGSNSYEKLRVIGYEMLDKWLKGYPAVCLSIRHGKKKMVCRHTMVLQTFVSDRPIGMEASHIDGNRLNPKLSNLKWETRKVNHARKEGHGTKFSGESHPRARLTWAIARKIRKLHKEGVQKSWIARQLGVNSGSVYFIINNKQWIEK